MLHDTTPVITPVPSLGKLEIPNDVWNFKFGNMTSARENYINIGTNASPKWDKTRCPEEKASSVG